MTANHESATPVSVRHPWHGVWIAYWLVAWSTTALFLLVVEISDASLAIFRWSFAVTFVWTLLGWLRDLLMLLLTPRDRRYRLPFAANCLLATVGRVWCFDIITVG